MIWSELKGHDEIVAAFRQAIRTGRLGQTYLLVGPSGIGKRKFAVGLAQTLLCEAETGGIEACGTCPSCQQVAAGTHPDLMVVKKPDGSSTIPLKLLIGPDEKRMREGLCYEISRKPFRGGRKVAIIDDADFLNQEGANALLKTLEEPPPGSVLLLIGTSEHRQLPTIRSRSQVIRFDSLPEADIAKILVERGAAEDIETARGLASVAGGSVENAIRYSDPEFLEFREQWLKQLQSGDPGRDGFAKELEDFVNSAGKDAALKRNRLRQLCVIATCHYRDRMVDVSAVETTRQRYADCIDACLEAQSHISANMNQTTLIEYWLSQLGRRARGEKDAGQRMSRA